CVLFPPRDGRPPLTTYGRRSRSLLAAKALLLQDIGIVGTCNRRNPKMKPSSGVIDISECAKRLDVDNQISLRHYYRIAHNLLKQVLVISGIIYAL
ncbi:hypothetical protein BHM03_00042408, partial [Ensete ventricosum]